MSKQCPICIRGFKEHGHNPKPFTGEKVCDECNMKYVIPLRIYQVIKEENKAVWFKDDGIVETVKPNGKYYTLEELQKLVGGYIEIYPGRYLNHYIVCDEEGIIKKRKYNSIFKALTGVDLFGDVLLCPENIFEEPDDE